MVNYADFKYYIQQFGGDLVEEDDFNRICRRASAFVREITFNRLKNEMIPDEVKEAVCAVCEVMWSIEESLNKTDGKEVKSVNTDGYSVSYVTEGEDGQSHEAVVYKKAYSAARPYLIHTGLLYRGC